MFVHPYRIRTLMIAVAVAGVVSSVPLLVRRSIAFQKEAATHAKREEQAEHWRQVCADGAQDYRNDAERARRVSERCMADLVLRANVVQALDEYEREREFESCAAQDALYHRRMRRKYERAVWWPLGRVAPDPPDPEDHSAVLPQPIGCNVLVR